MTLDRPSALSRAARVVLLVVVALLWVAPYLWMTVTSLKPLDEIVRAPAYPLPQQPSLAA
ncbi:MAG: hypothetical protein JNK04_03275, partial [Myxococcales bacterium]|nr:hypothetical protein [Myxococcales bacterium]